MLPSRAWTDWPVFWGCSLRSEPCVLLTLGALGQGGTMLVNERLRRNEKEEEENEEEEEESQGFM